MKFYIVLVQALLLSSFSYGQQKEAAEELVKEGVAYHDKGDYEGAVKKYDEALLLDKDNLLALAEKGMSLNYLKKYEESIESCEKAMTLYKGQDELRMVYVTCGNSYDGLNKTDKSLEVYDEGLSFYPEFFLLHFNKGITLAGVKKYDEAILCFQQSVKYNPNHASSHNALARMLYVQRKKVAAILAYSRFLIIEPQSERAKVNLVSLNEMFQGNVERTGKKSITINVSPDMLGDTTEDGRPNENSFGTIEMLIAFTSALDEDKKYKKETEVERLVRKFSMICSTMKETKKDNSGFYWDYYVPYFVELDEKELMTTFGYIAYASSDDDEVASWLKKNKEDISTFYNWSKNYNWD